MTSYDPDRVKVRRAAALLGMLGVAIGAVAIVLAQSKPPAREPAAPRSAVQPFKIYDWMGFLNQPDLRRLGFEPIFGAMDATFNRATDREADNVTVGVADPKQSLFAAKRIAVAAIGIKPLKQNTWDRPPAYAKVPQDIVFDLETRGFQESLDLSRPSAGRVKTIEALCAWVDAMREAAGEYDKAPRIGSYFPIGPFAESMNPQDPKYPGLQKVAERDFKPWLSRLDFTMPDCSIHGPDFEEWKKQVLKQLRDCKRWVPGKPVYVEMQLCYGHFTQDPRVKGELVPFEQWKKSIDWLVANPNVNGISLFGNDLEVPGLDRSRDEGNVEHGTRRLDFKHVERHVRYVAEASRTRRGPQPPE